MLKFCKYFFILMGALSLTLLSACQTKSKDHALRVGTIAGPETKLMEVAQQIAQQKYGLTIKIIEFTDYIEPNTALNDGSIDANMFQHQPYLDQQIQDKHYQLMAIGKTFVYPMGIYALKTKQLRDIPLKSIVAIPNDPSNEGRALLLLQKAGLITVKKSAGLYATPADIESNPKQLNFKELDAAQLARSLPDVGLAVINTNYAIPAGLSPTQDAIFLEDKSSPYANVIVIRKDHLHDPRMQQLVDAFQSDAVLQAAKDLFNNQAIPAWSSAQGNR